MALTACSAEDPSFNPRSRRSLRDRSSGGATSARGGSTGGSASDDDDGASGGGRSGTTTSGAASSGGGTVAVDVNDFAGLCVDKVNAYRASLGLPALARWSAAETCSDTQAASDSVSGTAHGSFGKCDEGGQCECPGYGSPAQILQDDDRQGCLRMMWNEGPGGGHYDIMSSKSYTRVACGLHVTPDGKVWSVQNYK